MPEDDNGRDLEMLLDALTREAKIKDDDGELKLKLQALLGTSERRIRPPIPMPQGRRLNDRDELVLNTVHNLELMIGKPLPDRRMDRIRSLTSLIMSELEQW